MWSLVRNGLGEGVAEGHPSGHSSRFLLAPPSIPASVVGKGGDLSGSIGARASGMGPTPCQTLARDRQWRIQGGGWRGYTPPPPPPPPPAKPVILTVRTTILNAQRRNDPSNSGRWSDCYKCPSPQDVVKYSDLYIQPVVLLNI